MARVGEGQVEVSIENEIVEALDRRAGEEIIAQLALPVAAAEGEAVRGLL